ncbi:hypothetical protein ROZALSC1DRAFT_26231, partial [Rozella allomycis CSF55]
MRVMLQENAYQATVEDLHFLFDVGVYNANNNFRIWKSKKFGFGKQSLEFTMSNTLDNFRKTLITFPDASKIIHACEIDGHGPIHCVSLSCNPKKVIKQISSKLNLANDNDIIEALLAPFKAKINRNVSGI